MSAKVIRGSFNLKSHPGLALVGLSLVSTVGAGCSEKQAREHLLRTCIRDVKSYGATADEAKSQCAEYAKGADKQHN